MSRHLYALDDQLARLLQSESFQGKFDVTSFVESLSERQLEIQRQNPEEPFQPKPLVRDFDTALQQLKDLKAKINEDIGKNAKEVRAAEVAHNTRIRLLNHKFEV